MTLGHPTHSLGHNQAVWRFRCPHTITYGGKMLRMGPPEWHDSAPVDGSGRLSRFTPLQQTVALILPIGFLLAFGLSLIDSVPTRAAHAAQRLGIYEQARSDIFGVHPWTWAHFFGWMALACAVCIALGQTRRMLVAGAAIFGLSVLMEFLQSTLTSERGYSFEDVVANGGGVALGTMAAVAITAVFNRRYSADPDTASA